MSKERGTFSRETVENQIIQGHVDDIYHWVNTNQWLEIKELVTDLLDLGQYDDDALRDNYSSYKRRKTRMTYYTDEEQKIERNGHVFTVKLDVDYDPDTSCIGEYTDKDDAFVVDRKAGFLYGDWEDEPEEPYKEDFASDAEYGAAYATYSLAYDEWRGKGEREILAEVCENYGRNEYQYFRPYAGGLDPRHPKTDLEEWTKYALQDWERMRGLERNNWCFVGMIVEVDAPACASCAHTETLYASVWGIESDCPDADFDQIRDDLIYELEKQLEKYDTVSETTES